MGKNVSSEEHFQTEIKNKVIKFYNFGTEFIFKLVLIGWTSKYGLWKWMLCHIIQTKLRQGPSANLYINMTETGKRRHSEAMG